MAKKELSVFEKRRRMIDEASGWAEPEKPAPKKKPAKGSTAPSKKKTRVT